MIYGVLRANVSGRSRASSGGLLRHPVRVAEWQTR